jgi:hypothetical protein
VRKLLSLYTFSLTRSAEALERFINNFHPQPQHVFLLRWGPHRKRGFVDKAQLTIAATVEHIQINA